MAHMRAFADQLNAAKEEQASKKKKKKSATAVDVNSEIADAVADDSNMWLLTKFMN